MHTLAGIGLVVLLALATSCSEAAQSTAQESDGRSVSLDLASGRPVVAAEIDSRGPFPIIFDTGAGTAVVLDSLKQELALPVHGQAPLTSPLGGGAAQMGEIVNLGSIVVAGIQRNDLQAVSIADRLLPLRAARGVIGPATFPDRVVEIDISAGTLWMGPAPRQAIRQWNPIGAGDKLEATITIGNVSIPAHIDTGNPGWMTLPTSFAARLPLRGPLRESSGMRTIDTSRILSLGRLEADATISGSPVRLDVVDFADLPTAGIGMQALQGFTVVVDYAHRRWALVGVSAGPVVALAPLGDFGARLMPELDGTQSVFGIEPGSRAESSGLRVGDRLVSVNGDLLASTSSARLRQDLAAPGARLRIERGGAPLDLAAD